MNSPRHIRPRRRRLLLTLLGVTLLGTACAGAPEPPRAPLDLPPRFSATGEAPLPEAWWLAFEDPGLTALIERALAGNLGLRVAWARLDRADATARKAGAERSPTLTAEGGFSRSRLEQGATTTLQSSFRAGLVAGYELDLWGRVRSGHAAARLEAEASVEELQTAALTLTAEIAATWYQLQEQLGQLALMQVQVETNRQILELTSLRFRAGQTGIADVLQQRQLLEALRGEQARTEARRRSLETRLAVLLGLPPVPSPELPPGTLIEPPPLPATGLPAELLARRPDIRGAWLRLAAAERRIAVAQAERLPRLSLSARAESSAPEAEALFDDWLASLAANLFAPLIDGGLRRAEVERTRAVAAEALHAYGQTVLEALAEVEDALAREQQQQEYLASLIREEELASQALARIRDRYTKGADDYQRVLGSLLTLQRVQRAQLTARRELLEDRVALCRALGGDWLPPRPAPAPSAERM